MLPSADKLYGHTDFQQGLPSVNGADFLWNYYRLYKSLHFELNDKKNPKKTNTGNNEHRMYLFLYTFAAFISCQSFG